MGLTAINLGPWFGGAECRHLRSIRHPWRPTFDIQRSVHARRKACENRPALAECLDALIDEADLLRE